ncbi:hypothetical protein BG015_006476 [Linnemannia schmuckeri]|uniref:Uncharacterized protein n=1 Tax=Linnemannia schmuckeri TaxID=64567 RepID=A0A9P5VFC6_9FUNG|nr:hypothetical protein BG015_006476 [Linnemannia schmuckeri]
MNVWLDDPQRAILQQIKKHTMGPNGYGRIRVPAKYYPIVDNGPTTIAVVKNAVATNNAAALSNELLKFFDSAAGYRRAVIYGTTDGLTTALVECLDFHIASSMFILQALMAVGEIAKTRDLDHEFEGMVSQFLLDVFCSPPPLSPGRLKMINSSAHITNAAINIFLRKSKNRRKKKTNPIAGGDPNLLGIGACNSLPDEGLSLLDFADYPNIAQSTSRNKAAVQGKPFNIMDADNDIIFTDFIDLIDLNDFQPTPTTPLTIHHQHDPTLASRSTKTKGHLNIPLPLPIIDTVNHHHLYRQRFTAPQETYNRTIQSHHHQEVLDKTLAYKSAFQIFLAIEAFELEPILLTHLFDTSNHHHDLLLDETNFNYGSLLLIQLIEQGYIEEAGSLALRLPINRGTSIDTNLVAILVEKNKLDMIHELIGDNKDLCRSVLHLIDRQLTVQIWNWIEYGLVELDQLDHFHAIQCMREGPLAKPSHATLGTIKDPLSDVYSAATSMKLIGLVETAAILSRKFELNKTMKTLQSLKFVTDLCIVISLLQQQDQQPISSKTSVPCPLEPIPTMIDDQPPSLSEYQLSRSWKFFPTVILILKNNVVLQRLVIWYGVKSLRDSSTASFLASKLGQRAYLKRCLEQVQV